MTTQDTQHSSTRHSFIDTDVIIRFLTGDDPQKQERAAALFKQVEEGKVILEAPDTVIADAVYVLSSPQLYKIPRGEVAALLMPLVRLPGFRVRGRRTVLLALALYGSGKTKLDFGDAMIVATMQATMQETAAKVGGGAQSGTQRSSPPSASRPSVPSVYSFDHDFDKIPNIARQEP